MRHALILAGGQGRRFWPRSRRRRPKQFMAAADGRSLIRVTADRLLPVVPFERQWVITHRDYVRQVRAELPEIPADQVIGEPHGLNTGPAVGWSAELMAARDPEAIMVVQGADHWVENERRFQTLIRGGFTHVEKRRNVLLVGFPPTRPATGYGYIAAGKKIKAGRGLELYEVDGYKEKPSAATARRYLASGNYHWNGCVFVWHAATIRAGIETHLPELGKRLEAAARRVERGGAPGRIIASLYRGLSPVSIEHGVVEPLDGKVVLVGDCGWEDVGTWESLARLMRTDRDGNVTQGNHVGLDTKGSVVLVDDGLVATLGVRDLIVVKNGDSVLVLPRSREGEVRDLIDAIEASPKGRGSL